VSNHAAYVFHHPYGGVFAGHSHYAVGQTAVEEIGIQGDGQLFGFMPDDRSY